MINGRMFFKSVLLLSAVSVTCVTFFLAEPAAAHASVGLTIEPIKISATLNPGQTASGTIFLTNASDNDVDITETLQDFVPVAGAEGMQFIGRAEGVTTVRDWISLSDSKGFLFKKATSQPIKYSITAPKDAEPGSHFGVIFFKASEPNANGTLKIGTQVGVLVLVTIPGEHLQKGNILSFSSPLFTSNTMVPFSLRFENTGTVYYEPKGEISITNMLGQKVGSVPIEGQIVLPTGVKDLSFAWRGDGLLFGRYKAIATIVDGEGVVLTSKEIVFYAAPLWYMLIALLSIVCLYAIFKILRKHVRISIAR